MYSPICPIGAPSRNYTCDKNPPKKPSAPRPRALTSTPTARPQGMVLSEDELPQIIKNLQVVGQTSAPRLPRPQSGNRRGMVFDVHNLPQELKSLQGHAPSGNKTRPA